MVKNCEEMLKPGLRFCTSCGTKVGSKPKAAAATDKPREKNGGGDSSDDSSGSASGSGMCLDDLLSSLDTHIEGGSGDQKRASVTDHIDAVKAGKTKKAHIEQLESTEHEL